MAVTTKVVITRQLPSAAQELLENEPGLEIIQWPTDQPCDRSWLLDNARGAAGILLMLSDACDEELLSTAGDSLKVIASFSVGTDHVEREALRKRKVRLGFTPTALTDAVADITIMLVLMAQRVGGESMRKVLEGKWPQLPWAPLLFTGPQIKSATVGFLGFGRIAQASLKRLIPFGIERALYLTSRPGKSVREDFFELVKKKEIGIEPAKDWKQLAEESDVIIVGCALTPQTKHFVNSEFFGAMKKTAVLVNIARGPVVDTNALVEALEQKKIFGAGLDVIENEPNIQANHPLIKQSRCVLLPHIGSANFETREQMATESVQNLIAGLREQKMVNEVDL